MTVYPLKMKPYFRHGSETPWGGGKLRELFNKDIPDDMTGESLEISALPGRESVIVNGELSGKTLTEAADVMGAELLGEFKEFPLLLKLLDAKERLSVQVHPDDEYAAHVEGKRGKTEAWYILNADPGAKLVFGVKAKSSEELRQIVASGHIEDTLNWIDVRPGDCLYIQSGTVHAIGGGIVLYEIQQSSDVTYRMWDWGRPREIHTQKALDVTRCDIVTRPVEPQTTEVMGGERISLIDGDFFKLTRLNVMGRMPVEADSFALITALGEGAIEYDGGSVLVHNGESVLIPAAMHDFMVSGHLTVLMSEPGGRC
ncbi:MAG: type I phosphomannose isomerase catalytic subunit [Christensenellales bacterium]